MRVIKVVLAAMMVIGLIADDAVAKKKVYTGTPVKEGSPAAVSMAGLPPIIGPKKLIAVGAFENKSNFHGQWDLGHGMADMLANSLANSGRFILLERPEVERILKEQNFAASDRTTKEGGAKIGKMLRSQILVVGAVTEFSQQVVDRGLGFATKKLGVGLKQAKAHVAITLRMIDTETGEVLYSERVSASPTATGIDIDYRSSDFAIGGEQFKKTPLGQATQEVIDQAVMIIARKMQYQPWKGRVVMNKGGKIYINAGQRSAIKPGMSFSVYEPGEALIDPETGLNLGSEEVYRGKVRVVEVKDKFSIAVADEGEGFERNDIVKYEIPKTSTGSGPRVIEGVPAQ